MKKSFFLIACVSIALSASLAQESQNQTEGGSQAGSQSATNSASSVNSASSNASKNYEESYRLEKSTITANKANEEIFEVNASVQTISGERLEKSEIKSTDQLANAFAGFQINQSGASAFPQATLRGLSSPDFYTTTLNVYVDGVPQSPNFLIQALGDVAQVELLRGAQGTLYGENSQAGLLSIITRNPMHGNYANISLGASILNYDINAYGGGEIIKNKLWGKANFRYLHDNGFIKDPDSSKMLNTADTFIAGASLYYAPVDSVLATLSYSFYHANSHKNFYLSKSQYENGYKLPNGALEVDNFMNIGNPNYVYLKNPFDKTTAHNASLKIDYSFGDSILSSISAFQMANTLNNNYPIVRLLPGKDNGYYYDSTQFIQELRLDTNYENGARSVFGVYYKHLNITNGMRGYEGTEQTFGFRDTWEASEKVNTIALFGDGKIPLGESWDIGFGARYQYYHANIITQTPPIAALGAYDKAQGFHILNPRLSLGYTLNSNARFYFNIAQSTKAGGYAKFPYANADTQGYKNEQIYSSELGSHLQFLDSKLRANTALYYMFIQDRQSYAGSGLLQSIRNLGDAYSYGLDTDIGYYGERVSASVGANIGEARYFKGGDNVGAITVNGTTVNYNIGGNRLKFNPTLSLVANVDWNFLRLNAHRFYIGANGRYFTKQYFDDLDQTDKMILPAYLWLDLNVRYEYKNWSVKLYTQNTTNSKSAVYIRNFGGAENYYMPNNPFNAGINLSYRY
ncbi:hypothetical protein CQA49_06360 [Helicobacter sp. MIT 00-7814]|uniref:TonB-dependent receptor n=1 Tax=unclassified Helicobacter TaxID=2593540 RepID=UPI000E1FB360|nr:MULTISPECIES: TonB-dependent receptor [unclassified Helicobacter]RDU53678.1 hypothetical protein CQA49_06360 [Helicobacter sp. MIT 00-7814]RDU54050.1 hypothetical protein CQA37_06325 [Helicobacter sp. MIT 99-10781]